MCIVNIYVHYSHFNLVCIVKISTKCEFFIFLINVHFLYTMQQYKILLATKHSVMPMANKVIKWKVFPYDGTVVFNFINE